MTLLPYCYLMLFSTFQTLSDTYVELADLAWKKGKDIVVLKERAVLKGAFL